MSTGLTIVLVVGMLCTTFIIAVRINGSSTTRPPLALTAYQQAKCDTAHGDGSSCVPLWDGKDYFCPYYSSRPQTLSDW